MWTARESSGRSWYCRMWLRRRGRRAHERKKNEGAGSFCLRRCNFAFCWGIGGGTVDVRKGVREESCCNDSGGAEIYRRSGGAVVRPRGEGFAGRVGAGEFHHRRHGANRGRSGRSSEHGGHEVRERGGPF